MRRRPLALLGGALVGLLAAPMAGVAALLASWVAGQVARGLVSAVVIDSPIADRVGRVCGEVALVPGAAFGLWALAQLIGGPRPIVRLLGVMALAGVAALGTLLSPLSSGNVDLRTLSALAAWVGTSALAGAALLAPEEAPCPPS